MERSHPFDHVRRATLPELLFAPDVAVALGVTEDSADAALREGSLGRYLLVDRRPAILRSEFIQRLAERASVPWPPAKELLP